MDPLSNAVLRSWAFSPFTSAALLLAAALYVRGWLRVRELIRTPKDGERLASFLAGLFLIFIATESPLDTFDSLFLSAHMTQHLILMMLAPPLILRGFPTLPLLRGLPKRFVKEGLGPFLTWPFLKAVSGVLVSPLFAWLAFAFSTIFWHVPFFYELALGSAVWHSMEHASFFWTGILFWWPVIQPTPAKAKWPLWSKIPYLLFADIVNTALSAFFVFSGRLLYPSYGLVRASSLSAIDDQIVAGLIMWVPGSLVYLVPAFAYTMQVLSGNQRTSTLQAGTVRRRPAVRASHWKKTPALRRASQYVMLLLAIAVMADGWFGRQITPLNLAGVLPWIHWRALSVLALLAVGNLFCMACPFTLVRDFGRKIHPAKLRWPRFLRNKWLSVALFVLYLWFYEAFALWNSPFLTAWIVFGYFFASFFIDGIYSGASFCKYVCPIGQFHFVSSLISPREVRVRNNATCQSCRTFDCIKGNQTARGCELDLFQPKKSSNLDCTFCLDCVKACPHDNVAVLPVIPMKTMLADPYRSSLGRLSKRTDMAVLVLVFVFGALANAAGMTEPVMMWEHSWLASMPLVTALFTLAAVVAIPTLAISLCWLLNLLVIGQKRRTSDQAKRLLFTLAPLGFSMWAAHLLYHFASAWGASWPALFEPGWLIGAQILFLDAGLLTSLYTGWKIASQVSTKLRSTIELVSPWAAVAITLYCAFAWVLFQPMQMRGMMQ